MELSTVLWIAGGLGAILLIAIFSLFAYMMNDMFKGFDSDYQDDFESFARHSTIYVFLGGLLCIDIGVFATAAIALCLERLGYG